MRWSMLLSGMSLRREINGPPLPPMRRRMQNRTAFRYETYFWEYLFEWSLIIPFISRPCFIRYC
jgi:hypothetical protein